MLTMQEIKAHYRFTDEDAELLGSLFPLAEANKERLADQFYDYLLGIPETAEFLKEDLILQKLKQTHQDWFVSLFAGSYDNRYIHNLQKIGHAHVRVGLNAHYVNVAMNVVRQFTLSIIQDNFPDPEERRQRREAVEKILDINLDIMSASYREEEMRKFFVSHRLESKLITATERFTYGLNLILVLALAGVSVSVVGLFIWDIGHIFQGSVEKGILSALGSLLILWMMIELIENEIKILKGGRFNILFFIGVIIVALIREILISTLRHDPLTTQVFLAGTLLVLGVVYFLVSKSQQPYTPH
ncbi:protoglobin domain-containing protein [Geobacter sulfurreducens]|uniref:protoglobin domain-containing protein n=1 Tax=Geobacter sulfurreducens TaxID=35554 RepID=UPI000DBB7D90|nr:protoglobin domain-containing protein [Geobacter sulfurreducens]BBA71712.1 Globin-coupled histidine kinase [Geobacter sulfurreducens]